MVSTNVTHITTVKMATKLTEKSAKSLTGFSHDEHIPAFGVVAESDVRHDDEDSTILLWFDGPHAVDIIRVVTRVVG